MKKFTSIIIALAMLCAMMVTMIPTASAAWDGSSVSAALIGSGTEFDPYIISSENDLAFVAKQVNDAVTGYEGEFFKLTVDLDLGNNLWTPIGVGSNYFRGTFDGDGHTVSNLNVKTDPENSSAQYGGLFGRVADGFIKNLTIDGAKVVSLKYAGTVAGLLSCTAETGAAAIINCRVMNSEVYGTQPGGIVGRCATTKATKGQLHITGCSVENLYVGQVSPDDYPKSEFQNHYIGGIVGCAGATVIEGCYVKNFTADVSGTGFAPAGGIVGCQGASSVATDINNCYVIGVNFKTTAECHPEKTSLGGLIGKAAHVTVMSGDTNKECHVFNCFVADVTLSNATSNGRDGMIAGWVNDTIIFNDIYYVSSGNLPGYGYDTYYAEWPFVAVNAASEIKAADLNSGNSTTVWTDDVVLGHPVIDVDAVIANQPTFVDYFVEHAEATTEPETTEAPVVTEPEATEPEATEPEATEPEATEPEATDAPTEAPVVTDAPAQGTEAPKEEKGCGGMIAGGVIIVALLGTAVVFKKRY